MVKEIQYINIREVLSRVLRHPLLQDCTLEQAIQYAIDFIGIFGIPEFYSDKEANVEIVDYMGQLPCDLISINMVKDLKTNIPLRSMTSLFNPGGRYYHDIAHEPQFKTQGRTIITTFRCGMLRMSYKAIPVDDEGMPLLVDNAKYLKALELYIRCQLFSILFDLGKINQQVLNHTEQEYAWAAGQLEEEFSTPSMAEMESITNMLNQMIVRKDEFIGRFERLGNKEHRILHNNNSVLQNLVRPSFQGKHPLPPIIPDAIPAPSKGVAHPMPPEPPEPPTCEPMQEYTADDIERIINQA